MRLRRLQRQHTILFSDRAEDVYVAEDGQSGVVIAVGQLGFGSCLVPCFVLFGAWPMPAA